MPEAAVEVESLVELLGAVADALDQARWPPPTRTPIRAGCWRW
jgi:hypothetical protein